MTKPNENIDEWYCPIFQANIAEGRCFDINYARLGYMEGGCLDEIRRLTAKGTDEVNRACESCPNLPVKTP